MDGLLVIDKPAGPTSHDVVARMRLALRERRIGHTGTLDPRATGVLPLVIGRATRLARFISSSDKRYRAVVRLGVRTDSGDADGYLVGEVFSGPLPARDVVEAALDEFRGTFLQQPPAFSAKKVSGRRSYALARSARGRTRGSDPGVRPGGQTRGSDPRPRPVSVTVQRLTLHELDGDRLTLDIDCSAGFYVRALADDLGQCLGTGAHLEALRRTESGGFTLSDAIPLEAAERDPLAAALHLVPLARLLPTLAAVRLNPEGVRAAVHGRDLGPGACEGRFPLEPGEISGGYVRLLDPSGDLLGIGEPSTTPGLLHPSVVLM